MAARYRATPSRLDGRKLAQRNRAQAARLRHALAQELEFAWLGEAEAEAEAEARSQLARPTDSSDTETSTRCNQQDDGAV